MNGSPKAGRSRPVILATLVVLASASSLAPAQSGEERRNADVVLFTSLAETVVGPVLEPFKAAGSRVTVVRVPRRGGSIDAVVSEIAKAKADVWWSPEVLNTEALKRAGALGKMTPLPAGSGEIAAAFHDPDGTWFGFAARARIIMVNTDLVPEAQRPRSMWDLLDPKWKGKVVIAKPSSGTALFHLLALEQTIGRKETERYLDGLRENGCRVASGDGQLAELIGSGEVAIGMTDTSDYRGVRVKGRPVDAIHPDQDGVGTLVIPNTIGWLKAGANPDGARRLIEYLLSGEAERILAHHERGQIPLRAKVAHPPDVKTPADIKVMSTDIGKAAALVETAGARLKERYTAAQGPWVQQPKETIVVDFDAMECGKPPAGMTIAQTGAGTIGVWSVVEDPTSRGSGRVVLQTDRADLNSRFPLCVYDGISAKDVAVTVAFKTMKGETDRASGLFLRYVDEDNYYCCRANSLEDNYRFYKVVEGRRSEIAGVGHLPVMEDVWQTLRLEAKGNHFRVWMNGTCLMEADDDTFPGPGKVGLWLKGDSITAFDDLVIGPPGARHAVDFESAKIGDKPEGWTAESLGDDAGASWSVVANPEGSKGTKSITPAKVENPGRSGWVLLDGANAARDVSVFTRFKVATEGPGMHLAGLVARYRGRDDHYYLRINPEESNIRFYRVAGGKRKLLGEVHHTRHDEKLWHTAQMTAVGPRVEVLIDGVVQFVAFDDAPPASGKAGVWAAPGGDTLYDEVSVESL